MKLTPERIAEWWNALGTSPEAVRTRIESIIDRFYQVLSQDLLVGFFFNGKDLAEISSRQSEFIFHSLRRLMSAQLSPDERSQLFTYPPYTGKAPAQAHTHLAPILTGHFDRRLRVLESTLREVGLPETVIHTWVNFEESFRGSIQQ